MATPIPPDDQLPPEELARRLLALVDHLPKMVHEQAGAAREDAAASLELARGLEQTVQATRLDLVRVGFVTDLQTSMLGMLVSSVSESIDAKTAAYLSEMVEGIDEITNWSDEETSNPAAWTDFLARRVSPYVSEKARRKLKLPSPK